MATEPWRTQRIDLEFIHENSVISVAIKNTQHIYDLVGVCAGFGVEKAVVCPGSRCAPLLIGFGKHPDIETISVTDERSAGFIGLGLAQQSGKPVVLVCTSGTAAQNFTPAVTEAYYQNVPLIVLTGDRPPEWIDQWDGQTIRQKNLYIDHIKGSFIYFEDNTDVAEKALELALDGATGPVHLNIPIQEPFYPESLDRIRFATKSQRPQRNNSITIFDEIWEELQSELKNAEKVMILSGQMAPNSELVQMLNKINVLIVGDVISNLHGTNNVIKSPDLLFKTDDDSLAPDFLITFGRSVISKNLKLYLRKYKPKVHWHIGLGMVGDPFQSLTKTVQFSPDIFFKEWSNQKIQIHNQREYQSILAESQQKVNKEFNSKLEDTDFNYFSAVQKVIQRLPKNSVLHLGNSMPVRIANFIGIDYPGIDVWCNRGTSGIDGVVSTAVGHALADPDRPHTLIIGDLSFFYDRNGLWLNHEFPKNLHIIILNDNGSGIFNMIPGPANQDGLVDLFTTPHNRTAKLTAQEYKMEYWSVGSMDELEKALEKSESGILEIFTEMKINTKVFKKITTN